MMINLAPSLSTPVGFDGPVVNVSAAVLTHFFTAEEVPLQDLALYVIGGKFASICDDFAVGENYDVASYDFVIDADEVCALAFHFPTTSELFLPFR
jgi:hypothetical protein